MTEPDAPAGEAAPPAGEASASAGDAAARSATSADATASSPASSRLGRRPPLAARLAAGLVGVLAVGATIGAAALLPPPSEGAAAPAISVTPAAAEARLACPGALLELASADAAAGFRGIGQAQTVTAGSVGSTAAAALTDGAGAFGSGAAVVVGTAGGGPVAAAQSQTVGDAQLSGFSATACRAPSNDAWLVGGAVATGRTTLVTLANPTTVDATVDLELYGADGAMQAAGADGIVVAANAQAVVPLASFAADLASPVIHVTSRGGGVVAALQTSAIRGIEPGGVDQVGAVAAPSTALVIPAIRLRGSDAVQQRLGQDGFADLGTVLRLLAPGGTDARVQVNLQPVAGGAGTAFTAQLEAGRVSDVSIDELEDGDYTATISADVPVVAALRASTASGNGQGIDTAWLPSAPTLGASAAFAVPNGPDPRLVLVNTGDTDASVALAGPGGSSATIVVPAGGAAETQVAPGTGYTATGTSGLAGAVGYAGTGALASVPVLPEAAAAQPVLVRP